MCHRFPLVAAVLAGLCSPLAGQTSVLPEIARLKDYRAARAASNNPTGAN